MYLKYKVKSEIKQRDRRLDKRFKGKAVNES